MSKDNVLRPILGATEEDITRSWADLTYGEQQQMLDLYANGRHGHTLLTHTGRVVLSLPRKPAPHTHTPGCSTATNIARMAANKAISDGRRNPRD